MVFFLERKPSRSALLIVVLASLLYLTNPLSTPPAPDLNLIYLYIDILWSIDLRLGLTRGRQDPLYLIEVYLSLSVRPGRLSMST